MRKLIALALMACLLATACRRKSAEAPPPAPPAPEQKAEAAPAPTEAVAEAKPDASQAPAATINEFQASPEYSDLNGLVEALYNRNKRLPTLAELTRANGRPLPLPPTGYKLVIDAQSKSVKAVPAK